MRFSGRAGIAWSLSHLLPGQFKPESRAAAGAVLEADASLHHLDQALADGEAEAGAAFLARGGGIGLRKAAEDPSAKALGDAGAAILHREPQVRARLADRDFDR